VRKPSQVWLNMAGHWASRSYLCCVLCRRANAKGKGVSTEDRGFVRSQLEMKSIYPGYCDTCW
jgi:hypothetical protein